MGGGSYSDKRYSDSSYSDRRYSDKCYSNKYACSETSWSAHLCRKLHSLFYAEFGAEFTSLSTSPVRVRASEGAPSGSIVLVDLVVIITTSYSAVK